ncbi:MAG: M20/M25/M40 family metallo-hydrolase [Bdellovibrionota bacterium]
MKLSPLVFLLLAPLAHAKQQPDFSAAFLSQCRAAPDCEVRLFKELSKTFRPSRKEDELRDYILAVKGTAEDLVWKQKLETFRDPIGNIMIRLPATGSFVGQNKPYFALQSHMDMVLAYSEAKPGENLEPYFKDGVAIEEKDGWLQAVGNRTTLGADNGIGVATELAYLVDDRKAHPPLELIFTVQEEIGLLGAAGSELPILSRKMLCLDGMTPEEGMIIAGAQGGHGEALHFNARATDTSRAGTDVQLNVMVTKMAGGHSGGDIHRGRTNAVKLVAELMEELEKNNSSVRLKSLVAGDIGVLNKIPNLFQAEIILAAASAEANLAENVRAFLLSRISQNADDLASAVIAVDVVPAPEGAVAASDFSHFLAGAIGAAPNGVLDQDPAFYHSVFTSNNLSYMRFGPTTAGGLAADFGFLARSFSNPRMDDITGTVITSLSDRAFVSDFAHETKMNFPPWMEPDSSHLMQDVLHNSGYFSKKFFLNAGLEPSAFKQQIPTLEVVALGPMIQYAHSVKERLKLDSIPPTLEGVKRIVQMQ